MPMRRLEFDLSSVVGRISTQETGGEEQQPGVGLTWDNVVTNWDVWTEIWGI